MVDRNILSGSTMGILNNIRDISQYIAGHSGSFEKQVRDNKETSSGKSVEYIDADKLKTIYVRYKNQNIRRRIRKLPD